MNMKEFKKMVETEGKTPEGAIKLLLIAVIETMKEKNKDGMDMWSLLLPHNEPPQKSARSQFFKQIQGTNFQGAHATSYLGGTPQGKYLDYDYGKDLDVKKRQELSGPKHLKIWIQSGGKDFSSPVQLKQNKDGYWKIFEYSSLYTSPRPAIDPDDF